MYIHVIKTVMQLHICDMSVACGIYGVLNSLRISVLILPEF